MINNITQTIMQVQNQQQQWQMERQQQNMHRNQELQQQWQMERQQQNMHRNQELQKEWLMERQQQVNMCRNQVEELEQQWVMARQRQERMHWDKELQQQWQMERQQKESRHMNQERERREQTDLRPEEDQWARMHHEHLWRKKWKPTDRKDHNIMVKVNTEKRIAPVTKVNQNKLGREMTMTKKSDSDSAKQMPSRCKVESSVKCKNLIDISQNKEKNQSSSEKTVTEIKSTSDFKDETREQIKQESVEKLSSVDDKTCESNDESSQDKKTNNCKKLNNDGIINKAHGAEEKETKLIPCKIELDGSTNSLGDRSTSNDDANAKLPKAPEVDKKAEIKDRFKYHANQQKRVRSPEKDNQNNHDELDKGLADAEDAMYKEEINETKVQLEKLTLTPKVNVHSESTLSREDLSKHISDTETNNIKNSLTQHVELKAQSILMKKDKCSDDQKTGLILEKVKEQDVAECKLSIKGPSDTIKATDHVQCLKKCESETKENSLANDVSDTSGADNKICSSERHGSEPTGESNQNRDGSGNISKQEGEHTTNNIEQNSRIEGTNLLNSACTGGIHF